MRLKFVPRRRISVLSSLAVIATFTTASILLQASSAAALIVSSRTLRPTFHGTSHSKNTMRLFSENNDKLKDTTSTEASDANDDFEPKTWNPLRLMVMKLGFTELRWTSPLNYEKREGVYNCAYCGIDLFDSDGKYDSGSGWPSFWRSTKDGNVQYKREWDGRLECLCGNQKCSAHLGHVFLDGPLPGSVPRSILSEAPRGDPRGAREDGYLPRFCVNGAALRFQEWESKKQE